ncbi:hypothetical protein ACWBQ1_14245 [Providencia rettgeri]
MIKSKVSKTDKNPDAIIFICYIFIVAFGITFISLTLYMLMEYVNENKLPSIMSSSYFTIAFSVISLFMSTYIYSKQNEPKTQKDKIASITTLVTILISLFFILKDTLFIDEFSLNVKLLIIIALLIFFIFTIGIRFLKITYKYIEVFNNGCCERFKEFFHYNRKRYY